MPLSSELNSYLQFSPTFTINKLSYPVEYPMDEATLIRHAFVLHKVQLPVTLGENGGTCWSVQNKYSREAEDKS
jgi:hypothetical protein